MWDIGYFISMNYLEITSRRQFKDAIGFSREEFDCLLLEMEQTYYEQHGQTYQEYLEECVENWPKLKTLGDGLFFVLFYNKNGLIWGCQGLVFGMSPASAHERYQFFSELLEQTLEKKSVYLSGNSAAARSLKTLWGRQRRSSLMALRT